MKLRALILLFSLFSVVVKGQNNFNPKIHLKYLLESFNYFDNINFTTANTDNEIQQVQQQLIDNKFYGEILYTSLNLTFALYYQDKYNNEESDSLKIEFCKKSNHYYSCAYNSFKTLDKRPIDIYIMFQFTQKIFEKDKYIQNIASKLHSTNIYNFNPIYKTFHIKVDSTKDELNVNNILKYIKFVEYQLELSKGCNTEHKRYHVDGCMDSCANDFTELATIQKLSTCDYSFTFNENDLSVLERNIPPNVIQKISPLTYDKYENEHEFDSILLKTLGKDSTYHSVIDSLKSANCGCKDSIADNYRPRAIRNSPQKCYYSGCGDPNYLECKGIFKITEQSIHKLKNDSVPETIINALSKLKDKEYKSLKNFLYDIKKIIGKNNFQEYGENIYLVKYYKKIKLYPNNPSSCLTPIFGCKDTCSTLYSATAVFHKKSLCGRINKCCPNCFLDSLTQDSVKIETDIDSIISNVDSTIRNIIINILDSKKFKLCKDMVWVENPDSNRSALQVSVSFKNDKINKCNPGIISFVNNLDNKKYPNGVYFFKPSREMFRKLLYSLGNLCETRDASMRKNLKVKLRVVGEADSLPIKKKGILYKQDFGEISDIKYYSLPENYDTLSKLVIQNIRKDKNSEKHPKIKHIIGNNEELAFLRAYSLVKIFLGSSFASLDVMRSPFKNIEIFAKANNHEGDKYRGVFVTFTIENFFTKEYSKMLQISKEKQEYQKLLNEAIERGIIEK